MVYGPDAAAGSVSVEQHFQWSLGRSTRREVHEPLCFCRVRARHKSLHNSCTEKHRRLIGRQTVSWPDPNSEVSCWSVHSHPSRTPHKNEAWTARLVVDDWQSEPFGPISPPTDPAVVRWDLPFGASHCSSTRQLHLLSRHALILPLVCFHPNIIPAASAINPSRSRLPGAGRQATPPIELDLPIVD